MRIEIRKLCYLIITIAVFIIILSSCTPQKYEDCILQNMQGVNSQFAAHAIDESCKLKFLEKKMDYKLPPEILGQLTGHASINNSGFDGNIYNGNNNWTITQLTIALTPEKKENDINVKFDNIKKYNASVLLEPYTNTNINFNFYADNLEKEYKWNITDARGYPKSFYQFIELVWSHLKSIIIPEKKYFTEEELDELDRKILNKSK